MQIPLRPLVIIPTYNERGNITDLVREVLHIDSRLHILIVDDNSADKTADVVLDLKNREYPDRIHLHSRPAKLGLGTAYVFGFKWGLEHKYNFMIQMDADWSHNPADLTKMLQFANEKDFVVASRYIKGGGTVDWGLGRKFLSKSASVYSRLILGSDFVDFTGGFNGWTSEVLEAIDLDSLKSDGYSFQIELKYLAGKLGFRHVEFPITFTERRAGQSKMSMDIAIEACWRVWKFRWDWHRSHRK